MYQIIDIWGVLMDIKVYNASDEIDAERILSLLEDNNIKGYSHDSGLGGYMELTRGFSTYGKDIYVDESDSEQARALIKIYGPEKDDDLTDYGGVPWYNNKRIIARIILAAVVCMVAVCAAIELM